MGWFGLAAVDFSFWDDFDIDTFSASALKERKMHSVYNHNENMAMVQSFIALFMLSHLLDGMNDAKAEQYHFSYEKIHKRYQ